MQYIQNRLGYMMIRILFYILAIGIFFPVWAYAYEETNKEYQNETVQIEIDALMKDIKKEIKQRRGVKAELDDVVEKYIPIGISKETVLLQFQNQGFRIKESYYYKNSPDYDKYDVTYGAYRGLWLFPSFIFGHDLIIYFDFNNNKLVRVRASASLSHL